MSVKIARFVIAFVCLTTVSAAQEVPTFKVGARVQGWFESVGRTAPDGSTAKDFIIRRGYVYVTGTFPEKISLFGHIAGDRIGQGGLDNPSLGLGTGVAVRDLWIAWEPTPAFRVQMGRMYIPFTRALGTESAFMLLGVDMPSSQGGTRGTSFYASKVGRDDGAVFWGTPLAGHLQYRFGVMHGVKGAADPSDSLRLVGRLALSFLDSETTWFNRGTYLGTKKVLAVAVAVDREGGLAPSGVQPFDSRSWTTDAFFDHPLGRGALTVEGSFTGVNGLTQPMPSAGLHPGDDAHIGYAQAGYLLPPTTGKGRLQLYGRLERVDGAGDAGTTAPAVGANYFVRGHDLKVTLEYNQLEQKSTPTVRVLTFQAQVGF